MKTILILLLMLVPVITNADCFRDSSNNVINFYDSDSNAVSFQDSNGDAICTTTTTSTTTTTTTSTTTTTLTYWGQFDWDFAYDATDLDPVACNGSPCSDTDEITAWNDLKGSFDLTVPDDPVGKTLGGPHLDADICPNSMPGLVFVADKPTYATPDTLFNDSASYNCGDANHRCSWVVIAKWNSLPSDDQEAFLSTTEDGLVTDNRGKVYSYQTGSTPYKVYNGGTMVGALSEGHITGTNIETSNYHAYVWDINGFTDNGYNTFTIDNESWHGFAGPNTRSQGITIAGTRDHTSNQFADQTFCAMGLYKGDVTADASWETLQQYVWDTWDLGLKTDCSGSPSPCDSGDASITGIESGLEWDIFPNVTYVRFPRKDYFRVGGVLTTAGIATTQWVDTATITLEWSTTEGGTYSTIPTSTDDIYSPSDPVVFSNVQDSNWHTAQVYSNTPGTYWFRAKAVVTGDNPNTYYSTPEKLVVLEGGCANNVDSCLFAGCDGTYDCFIYANTDDLGVGQVSTDGDCSTDGNGTYYHPYCTLADAVDGIINDLGITDISGWTSGKNLYIELSGATADVQVNITGITTDSDNQIIVEGTASAYHVLNGTDPIREQDSQGPHMAVTGANPGSTYDTDYWHAEYTATGDNQATISSDIDYITIKNCQAKITPNGHSGAKAINLTGSNGTVDNCIVDPTTTTTTTTTTSTTTTTTTVP